MELKRILVPVDFSMQSSCSILCGKKLAAALDAQLYLLHVIDCSTVESVVNIHLVSTKTLKEQLTTKATKKFSILEKEYALDEVKYEIIIKTGGVFLQILQAAKEIDANLIIVHSRGGSKMSHLMFGSTSEKLVHYSHSPVLVLKENPKF